MDIGRMSCKIKKGCILEGELVVYSDVVCRPSMSIYQERYANKTIGAQNTPLS